MTTERVLSVSERLYWATQDKDLAAITTLIDEGADVNWANENFEQRTSLQIAVRDGFTDAVKLLLDRGANVNKTNKQKWTPLHTAALSGDAAMVRLLLDAGADKMLRNENGRTALDVAIRQKKTECATVLGSA